MPLRVVARTRQPSDTTRVPGTLAVGTSILASLSNTGILGKFEAWFPVSRRGGHGARALLAFATVFLLSGRSWGIRPFALKYESALQRLVAPVAGLCGLPTAASVSRALGRFTYPKVRACLDVLLSSDPDLQRLLASPHVQHRDAHGHGWHVLDFDPTVEPFRQRTLPDDPSLPAPTRIAPGTPGYKGHKRGELRIRHLPLLHAGSGAWLGYRLDATGGSLLPLLAEVIGVARKTLQTTGAVVRAVVRADGEFGSVGAMRTCIDAGCDVLTRLCRYGLLDRDEVVACMPSLVWMDVVGSGGGPPHQAADLGMFTLYPVDDAAGAEGGPVDVRVVVTRFPRSSPAERGVLRDGYQLELFATTLAADAWPPDAVSSLYFGRATIENCFAQEDREFGMDRTFSYHPPGQEWMSGVALFLWNVLLGRGVVASPLPACVRAQESRPVEAPAGVVPSASVVVTSALPAVTDATAEALASTEKPTPKVLPTDWSLVGQESPLHADLWSITREAFADLADVPGWRLDDERMEVRCPAEKRLFAFSAESHTWTGPQGVHTKNRLLIRTQAGACDGCPFRVECRSSDRPKVPKQLCRAIAPDVLVRATELIHSLRKLRRSAQIQSAIDQRRVERTAAPGTRPAAVARPFMTALPAIAAGGHIPDRPLFLPARSRALARGLLAEMTLHVNAAARPGGVPPPHPLLARDAGDREHRRLGWRERALRWQGPAATLILSGPGASRSIRELISRYS